MYEVQIQHVPLILPLISATVSAKDRKLNKFNILSFSFHCFIGFYHQFFLCANYTEFCCRFQEDSFRLNGSERIFVVLYKFIHINYMEN